MNTSLSVAFQMDSLARLDPRGDTTFAMVREARARGWETFAYRPEELTWSHDAGVCAPLRSLWVSPEDNDAAAPPREGEATFTRLATMRLVLVRQDPPFDLAYITTTYLLERLMAETDTLVVNHPGAIRDVPEKIFVANFSHFMPKTVITRSPEVLRRFRIEQGAMVLKPLYGAGGSGVFVLPSDDPNFDSLVETMLAMDAQPLIGQQYLPEIAQGDKRIILVDGKAAGALNRFPAVGATRANLHVGGRGEVASLTSEEEAIVAAVGPKVRECGLMFVGIDVIGGRWLTEINVTSPTGAREILRGGGPDVVAAFWDALSAAL